MGPLIGSRRARRAQENLRQEVALFRSSPPRPLFTGRRLFLATCESWPTFPRAMRVGYFNARHFDLVSSSPTSQPLIFIWASISSALCSHWSALVFRCNFSLPLVLSADHCFTYFQALQAATSRVGSTHKSFLAGTGELTMEK